MIYYKQTKIKKKKYLKSTIKTKKIFKINF